MRRAEHLDLTPVPVAAWHLLLPTEGWTCGHCNGPVKVNMHLPALSGGIDGDKT
jgi:hypothetical protein